MRDFIEPISKKPVNTIIHGHALHVLRGLPPASVHCIVTSPPYWGLRDYGIKPQIWGGKAHCVHEWGEKQEHYETREEHVTGKSHTTDRFYSDESRRFDDNHQKHTSWAFCRLCSAWLGSFGLEPTPELYVEHAVEIFRAARRVLRPDGTLWLNLGDSYATGAGKVGDRPGGGVQGNKWKGAYRGNHADDPKRAGFASSMIGPMIQPNPMPQAGLKPKDLVGIPWRVAFALQADGWYLRSDIIWAKPNPMPESVTDRPTKAHEYVFLLSKNERYYYDQEAVKEASTTTRPELLNFGPRPEIGYPGHNQPRKRVKTPGGWDTKPGAHATIHREGRSEPEYREIEVKGRNLRSVWTIATAPFAEAHFATFPPALARRCILAGTSEKGCCPKCGAPWVRVIETTRETRRSGGHSPKRASINEGGVETSGLVNNTLPSVRTLSWSPACSHGLDPVPCVVLDPFGGAGTVGMVAKKTGRNYILIELNPSYCTMGETRILKECGDLF